MRLRFALAILALVPPLAWSTGCVSCNAIAAPSYIEVRLAALVPAHPAGFSVRSCYGDDCVDTTIAAGPSTSAGGGGEATAIIPLLPIAAPAQVVRVQATDRASGGRFLDASLALDVPVRDFGTGACAVPYRRATVEVTPDGRLTPVS
jgi:hypothetical protein